MQEHFINKQSDIEQIEYVTWRRSWVGRKGQNLAEAAQILWVVTVRKMGWQREKRGPFQAEGMAHTVGTGVEEANPVQVIPRELAEFKW